MQTYLAPDRLTAVDLTALPAENMAALRQQAIRDGISIAELVARVVRETSERLLAPRVPTVGVIISNTIAARDGLETSQPEGQN